MDHTASEVLEFVRENDVKFIRLGFCDPFGRHKNISILPDELPAAFENGVSFDASAIKGFRDVTRSDLLLFPDPATLRVLPWRTGPGRVIRFYCDIRNPDGTPFAHDSRQILKAVVARSEAMGYRCSVGAECEFYLFKSDEEGEPTLNTLDKGGYLDISPLDKGENIRREICLCLEEMGIRPESSHHEQGPGQNEINFKFSDPLSCADNLLTFQSVVKAIAARNGLFASFMPKPLSKEAGSGLHINLSLGRWGSNLFRSAGETADRAVEQFMAGILARIPEITLFLNPIANSYQRLGRFEAPGYVSWSRENRSQLVRLPAAVGERARMELRSPDPAINPYLSVALILTAGLDGIERGVSLSPSVDADLYTADSEVVKELVRLPASLDEAITLAESSSMVRNVLGEALFEKYLTLKKEEAAEFASAADKEIFCRERYFSVI